MFYFGRFCCKVVVVGPDGIIIQMMIPEPAFRQSLLKVIHSVALRFCSC